MAGGAKQTCWAGSSCWLNTTADRAATATDVGDVSDDLRAGVPPHLQRSPWPADGWLAYGEPGDADDDEREIITPGVFSTGALATGRAPSSGSLLTATSTASDHAGSLSRALPAAPRSPRPGRRAWIGLPPIERRNDLPRHGDEVWPVTGLLDFKDDDGLESVDRPGWSRLAVLR